MTDHPAEIQKLLQDLNDLLPELDAETRGIQLYGAPGLNVFSMFQPDERRVARILADLLDPKGRHGQGDLFLSAFLFAVGLPSLRRNDRVSVVVDEVTSEGRLVDITVNTSNSLLGIEVKLFSGQQKNQLQDYANHLKNNAVGRPMALVFLADQVPDTARNEVIRMPWAKPMMDDEGGRQTSPLSNILKKTLPRVRATRTRTFMDDFLIWIDNEFGGSSMNNSEFRPYVDAVVENLKDKNKHRSLAIFMLAQSTVKINRLGDKFDWCRSARWFEKCIS
ncbi:MAG: hypothetical protein B7X48_13595 [Acidiphilium sp. 34-60-192]|nr:MAG: hypothetical protein B7X48_13595 [Acidiphilium sp. 34-60-192]